MKLRNLLLGAVAVAATTAAPQAQAITFNLISLNAGTAVGTQARMGFEIATQYWSSVLKDPGVVNLQIGFSTLGTGILGSTGSTRSVVSMNQVYNALNADKTSALDNQAVGSLQPLGASTFLAGQGALTVRANALNATNNGYIANQYRTDNDGGINNTVLALNTANAKALGITTNYQGTAINYAAVDGSIQFSDAFEFDFNPTDGISATGFDFIGIAIHEIGHALGFVSGVDSYDARSNATGTNTGGNLESNALASALDLFRYSIASNGTVDWTTGGTPYFSINGGATQLGADSRFSTGVANGDGRQASHWKDSAAGAPQLGILDPTSARGQMQDVTSLDLSAYDAMGWNISFDTLANPNYRYTTADIYRQFATAVPETTTWGMMILGFGLIGGTMRRRSTKVSFA